MIGISEWKKQIEFERENKDRFFGMHFQSPIPPEERQRFRELNCYSPIPDYRFELELYEHNKKKIIKREDTQGNERHSERSEEPQNVVQGKLREDPWQGSSLT